VQHWVPQAARLTIKVEEEDLVEMGEMDEDHVQDQTSGN
jgi:hypothetical protein